MTVYDEFYRLLKTLSPVMVQKLPADGKSIITEKRIKDLILRLKEYFAHEPKVAKTLLEMIGRSKTRGGRH